MLTIDRYIYDLSVTVNVKKGLIEHFFLIALLSLLLTAHQCEQPPYCGDGRVNQVIEECDGTDLGQETCVSLEFTGGRISCLETCQYNTDSCTFEIDPLLCGDGIINQDTEECDGEDLGGATCETFGFNAGVLSCTELCVYDPSQCYYEPQYYDDFESGSLDPEIWEIRQDPEGQPLAEEHDVRQEHGSYVFHTQQDLTQRYKTQDP